MRFFPMRSWKNGNRTCQEEGLCKIGNLLVQPIKEKLDNTDYELKLEKEYKLNYPKSEGTNSPRSFICKLYQSILSYFDSFTFIASNPEKSSVIDSKAEFSQAETLLRFLLLPFIYLLQYMFFLYSFGMNIVEKQSIYFDLLCGILSLYIAKLSRKFLASLIIIGGVFLIAAQSRLSSIQQNFEVAPLFSRYSVVTDYSYGELDLLKEELLGSDMTFVLFYAPWDRQSIELKPYFSMAASYYHEQINFAAINCWLPGSECKRQYNLLRYPAAVLYVRLPSNLEVISIPYTGPLQPPHIIRFLRKSLRPFNYVSNQADLANLQIENQIVVLGYFAQKSHPSEFHYLYYASLVRLQFEHMNDVTYAVTYNTSLNAVGYSSEQSTIQMVHWNETLVFPMNLKKNVNNITDWVNMKAQVTSKWISLDDRKSITLSKVSRDSPMVVFFIPDNPYHSQSDALLMLKAVSMDYLNCKNDSNVNNLIRTIEMKMGIAGKNSEEICKEYIQDYLSYEATLPHSLIHEDEKRPLDDFCYPGDTFCSISKDEEERFLWDDLWTFGKSRAFQTFSQYIQELKGFYNSKKYVPKTKNESLAKPDRTKPCPDENKVNQSLSQKRMDEPIYDETISQMKNWYTEDQCKRSALGNILYLHATLDNNSDLTVSGLGCNNDKALKFITIDSLLQSDFASRLGVDLPKDNRTSVWIVDSKREEHHHLDQPLSRSTLVSFIYNYTNGLLSRTIISGRPSNQLKSCPDGQVCLTELAADNYMQVTQTKGQAFVVLHYTPNCGACKSLNHLLLACLHLSSKLSNLTFARIDIAKNTLPWQFTFSYVPTIVFHPHVRKSETKVFNSKEAISVQSLMHFIFTKLSPDERLKIALSICGYKCQEKTHADSIKRINSLETSIMNVTSELQRKELWIKRLNIEKLGKASEVRGLGLKKEILSHSQKLYKERLSLLRSKLYHLSTWKDSLPVYPTEFSTYFSSQTYLLTNNQKRRF